VLLFPRGAKPADSSFEMWPAFGTAWRAGRRPRPKVRLVALDQPASDSRALVNRWAGDPVTEWPSESWEDFSKNLARHT